MSGLELTAIRLGQICTALDYEEESLSKLFPEVNEVAQFS